MSVSQDIVATYRGPGTVVRRLLARGQREDRALAILMAGCLLVFVSQWPRLARQAHVDGSELNPLLGGALLAWLIIAPLIFYGLAAGSHLLAKPLGGRGSFFGARLALFWALLAASPLFLLNGLLAGFVGAGTGPRAVEFLTFVVFLWFWLAGLRAAERPLT
ncbi:MAG: YIP1 family protein [Rhodobacteraceae bacterium]|nr:MAG: YIP1 family protein [Paracoccaceae bacterium]